MLGHNRAEPTSTIASALKNCPGLAGEIARHINDSLDTEQPGISLSVAISFVAALRSGRISLDGLAPNIYTLAIAPSGVGKSRAQHLISDVCTEASLTSLLMGRPASDSGILKRLQNNPRQFLIWDEFGLAFSEMSKSSSSYRVAIIETLMDLFSSSGRLHIGKEYANQERIDVNKPALSICAASTPDRFYDALNKNFVTDGFLVRWLVFPGEEKLIFKESKKNPINFIDEIINYDKGQLKQSGGNLEKGIVQQQSEMKLSSEIRKLIKGFFQNKASGATSTLEQAFWNRGNEHTMKLCMIFSDRNGVCSDERAAFAWDLVTNLIEALIQKCSLDLSNTKADKVMIEAAQRFCDLIAPGERITQSELTYRAHAKGIKKQERISRTDDLLEAGLWQKAEVQNGPFRKTTYITRLQKRNVDNVESKLHITPNLTTRAH